MTNYTASLLEADVIVGSEGNHFAIEITPEAAWGYAEVCVRVSIPYGSPAAIPFDTERTGTEQTFLLLDEDARPTVKYRYLEGEKESVKMGRLEENPNPVGLPPAVCWESWIEINSSQKIGIDVTGIVGNVPPGTAKVFVGIRGPDEDDFSEPKGVPVMVKLASGETGKPKIHYFDASPDYVLHAGEKEVVLSFYTTGAKTVTLFKNNVKVWPPAGGGGSTDLRFIDKPAITSVYRLEAAGETTKERDLQLKDKDLVVRPVTVQVAQAGWNRQPLHMGYPTVLMAHKDSSGVSGILYGVFVNPKTKAAKLYSSATGFPPWKEESDFTNIQSGSEKNTYSLNDMSHSPGVACNGKLWLIGGSSVDPTVTSNEVWYYHKNQKTSNMEWVRDNPGPFPKRMGHCVLDFNKKLWVLGGYDQNRKPQQDVWSYDYEKEQWCEEGTTAEWPARCLFAAVATPAIANVTGFEEAKMWVYGGTRSPAVIKAKTDLWSTTDGKKWYPEENTFELGPLPGQPNGATLFWDDSFHLAGSFQAPTKHILEALKDDPNHKIVYAGGTISSMVYTLCPDRSVWEANPVSWGWEQFGGNPFLMQSIVFNRFWFFWSLRWDIETAPKLNVFIPS